jgi:hypothetical protein
MTAKTKKPSIAAAAPAKPAPKAAKLTPLSAKEFAAKVKGKKVHLLVKENPKRGKSAKRFSLYREGMAVEAALAAGVWPLDLSGTRRPTTRAARSSSPVALCCAPPHGRRARTPGRRAARPGWRTTSLRSEVVPLRSQDASQRR